MGSAADVRFSLSTATHVPPGLHRRYSALRDESAKVRGGGMCVGVSLGNLGSIRPCVWLQLHRRLACGAKPCPAFSPVNDSCSLGVGTFVSCNSCDMTPPSSTYLSLPVGKRWGGGGRRPVVPEAPTTACERVPGCAPFISGGQRGGWKGKMELMSFLEQKYGL